MPSPVVFVVEDHPPVRESFVALFESAGLDSQGFATAQEFMSHEWIAQEFVAGDAVSDKSIAQRSPHSQRRHGCLVLDIELQGTSGLEVQARLRQRRVDLPIVFVTGHGDIATAVEAIRGGAVDFLEKPIQHDVLLQSVRRAIARDAQARRAEMQQQDLLARLATLSPRQRQVLDLIVEGRTNKTMAERLGVRAKTIEFHRANIMRKMQADSAADLIRMMFGLPRGAEVTPSDAGARRAGGIR